ncbi:hypothetical protein KBC99_01150 [Candidatus Saccharibacteria bacterium]|nr:hypothetical protein [Candidatus Saccharibacteria bacterium]
MTNNTNDQKLLTLSAQLKAAEENLKRVHEQLDALGIKPEELPKAPKTPIASALPADGSIAGKIIEGMFDGQNMIGPGDKTYPVPANYASKSKLVEGDTLKLTISDDGSFIYKQIGPVERKKLIGRIILQDGTYMVEAGGKHFSVLFASVTYFKAQPGDEVTVVIPADREAHWAAIEAVIG